MTESSGGYLSQAETDSPLSARAALTRGGEVIQPLIDRLTALRDEAEALSGLADAATVKKLRALNSKIDAFEVSVTLVG